MAWVAENARTGEQIRRKSYKALTKHISTHLPDATISVLEFPGERICLNNLYGEIVYLLSEIPDKEARNEEQASLSNLRRET